MKHLLKVFALSFLGFGLLAAEMPQAEAGSRHKRAMSSRARARVHARKVQRARINARIRHKNAVRRARARNRAAVHRARARNRAAVRRAVIRNRSRRVGAIRRANARRKVLRHRAKVRARSRR